MDRHQRDGLPGERTGARKKLEEKVAERRVFTGVQRKRPLPEIPRDVAGRPSSLLGPGVYRK